MKFNRITLIPVLLAGLLFSCSSSGKGDAIMASEESMKEGFRCTLLLYLYIIPGK